MSFSEFNSVGHTHLREQFAGLQIVLDLFEYPWMTICRASDHDAVNAISVKVFFRLLRRIYITVSDNRDVHSGVLLYLSDQSPVGFPLIHLAACAAMHCKRLNAHILKSFGEFDDDFRVLVPAKACLYGNRQLDRFHHLSGDFDHLVRLSHHSGTGTAACNLADRASEIDVYKVCSMTACNLRSLLGHLCRIHHRLGDVSVYLDADRGLIVVCDQLFQRLSRIADEPVG